MLSHKSYQLLDFGAGRKLERFGPHILDRPAPAAETTPRSEPARWSEAAARFERVDGESGRWNWRDAPLDPWKVRFENLVLELRSTDSGQVGLFPEQAENWVWVAQQVRRAAAPVHVLNLFAYTGAATLAAAAAGAHVTHVDASRAGVAWARRNTDLSGLAGAPIRWIVDDAMVFARRELQRGRQYDGIILDPPSYGHGPHGESWKIHAHLAPLLAICRKLTEQRRLFVLLTCHTPGFGPPELEALLGDCVLGACSSGVQGQELAIRSSSGLWLPSGAVARWPGAA